MKAISSKAANDRILAAAAHLFAKYGYNGVSTRNIAVAADVNEVTIYRHYTRKRDLFLAVLESELRQVHLGGYQLARLSEAASCDDAVERTFEWMATTFTQRPDLARLLIFGALELDDDLPSLLQKHLGELIEVVARYIGPWLGKDGKESADARTLIVAMAALFFAGHLLPQRTTPDGTAASSSVQTYLALGHAGEFVKLSL